MHSPAVVGATLACWGKGVYYIMNKIYTFINLSQINLHQLQ